MTVLGSVMVSPRVTRECSICNGERGAVVNALLAAGRTLYAIEREMRNVGYPTKAETVKKHLDVCLQGQRGTTIPDPDTMDNRDFAALVRSEAVKQLASGNLRITATHGLQAQSLIDRRAEKMADRGLSIRLAELMGGGTAPPEIIVSDAFIVIE
jgi:hypothetical protein